MLRVPVPSLVIFPEDKSIYEAATAAYVSRETTVPTPRQLAYGNDRDVGPYIIMDLVRFRVSVSKRLTRPNEDAQAPYILDSDASAATLEAIWTQIASCTLRLSDLKVAKIGSLVEESRNTIEVAGRPLTHNMNDMIRLANIPACALPQPTQTYATADAWYTALAEMHLAQLAFQQNDLIVSEDDCRNKYVARQIFRRLARDGRLASFGFANDDWSAQASEKKVTATCPAPSGSENFRLWGDDFRGGNILLDEDDKIAALIDWEYTYVAPAQFVLDPPWWLLIETAEMWSKGTKDWIATYEKRLVTWLASMVSAEGREGSPSPFPKPLSVYMRESWDTGRFWLSYGARKSWVFDTVFWRYLDERFFGARKGWVPDEDLWKTRVDLLSNREREYMEIFVKKKMEETKERRIVDWEEDVARQRMAEMLFD